jgi:plastocyanin
VRAPLIAVLVAGLVLAVAGSAAAAPVTKTFTYGPVSVDGYAVKQSATAAPRPEGAGFITHMSADVVDVKTGKPVPIDRIMLHHILFLNLGNGSKPASVGNSFYGDGEERAKLDLPAGYGYPVAADDRWAMVWMLMNHRLEADSVLIRYRITWDTDPSLTPVVPVGFDASHLRQGLVYDVPGGGRPGSTHTRTMTRPSPVTGRIVGGLGHVHGGAKGLELSQPTCADRVVYASKPTWGRRTHPFYNVKPILHEPGPIDMSRFISAEGIPVVQGQPLKLTSRYDAHRPHTRVMGLMVVYIAPDESVTDGCGPLPGDVQTLRTSTRGRAKPPAFRVPLTGLDDDGRAITIARPPGPWTVFDGNATVDVDGFRYSRRNVSVPRGATVTWRFPGQTLHDVTLADGPYGFSSNHLARGDEFSIRLKRRGTYKLFCSLHPVQMTQVVKVR